MALPYLLSAEEYFNFNNEYYLFSLLVLLSGFGFEFAYYRYPTGLLSLIKLIALNSLIFLTILYFGGLVRIIDINLLLIVLASFAFIIVNIFQFTLLFNKQKKKYFIFSFIFYFIFLISIPVHLLFGITFFYLFALFSVLGFVLAMLYVYKKPENTGFKFRGWSSITQLISSIILNKRSKSENNLIISLNPLNKYYQIGFNALIINGFITLVLSINHLTANILFEKEVANTIVIAWLFTFPILHAGNIAEKVFYNSGNLIEKYKKWVGFLFLGIFLYVFAFLLAYKFVPNLFPKIIVEELFFSTAVLLLPALGVYSIINAPLNAFVFKYLRVRQQRFITVYLGIAIVVLYFLSIYNLSNGIEANDLLLKSLGFFSVPIIVKTVSVGRFMKKRKIARGSSQTRRRTG
jgi:hypothetical protein